MSTHDDLLAVRDAVLGGADWLEAMLDVAGPGRGKRFVMMRIALVQSIPTRGASYLLSDFLAKANAEQVADFFYATAQRLPPIEPDLPTWPVLNLPGSDEAAA